MFDLEHKTSVLRLEPFADTKDNNILDFFNGFGARDISLSMIATAAIANIQPYYEKYALFEIL